MLCCRKIGWMEVWCVVQRCWDDFLGQRSPTLLCFWMLAGKRRAVQIPFNLDEDMPGKIVQELLEEHCPLSLSITTEESDCIVDLFSQKLSCNYNAVYRTVSGPLCPQKTGQWVAA